MYMDMMIQFAKLLVDIGLVSLPAKLLVIFINLTILLLNLSLGLARKLLSHTKTIFLIFIFLYFVNYICLCLFAASVIFHAV